MGLGWILGLVVRLGDLTWGVPLLVGLGGAGLSWRRPRLARTWLVAGLLGLLSWGYLSWRMPVPGPNDISLRAPQLRATIVGTVGGLPRATRSGRLQFWLDPLRILKPEPAAVTGKLYVTLDPVEQDLLPGQTLRLSGSLYRPSAAQNPGGFDFRRYLRQQGSFAGLSAHRLEVIDARSLWGGWVLRRRIRTALVQGLGAEQGELLSSLAIGSAAADLDPDLREAFREVGLAHALAASGFQVSLLVGLLLALTRSLPLRAQQAIGLGGILVYVVLTGFSASVARAALMGSAALLVLSQAKSGLRLQPLGSLLVAAVVLLIVDPNLIADLGFQLSFAATLGLLVGAKPVQERLDRLPPSLAGALAIPIAATIWTLPLQIVAFGKISVYVLLANLVAMPFVTVLSVLGFVVCGLALLLPPLGSALAAPLTVLLTPLVNLVTWIAAWPSSSFYLGEVSWIQAGLLYGALLALTFWPRWRLRLGWQATGAIMAGILILPGLWPGPDPQFTALATRRAPVLAIRTQGQTLLVNSGAPDEAEQIVLPFLRRQGIRQIDWGIALSPQGRLNGGWETLAQNVTLRQLRGNRPGSPEFGSGEQIVAGSLTLRALSTDPLILSLKSGPIHWLLLGSAGIRAQERILTGALDPVDWLWWDGGPLSQDLLARSQARHGLASGSVDGEALRWFGQPNRQIWRTDDLGALGWIPDRILVWRPE